MMDTMSHGIVKRLRQQSARMYGAGTSSLLLDAADEIERLRAEVAQLRWGAFVLNVHEKIYEAGKSRLIAWESLDWESLSAGREATYVPVDLDGERGTYRTYDHE